MRGLFGLAVAAATALVSQSLARPIIATPGGVESIIITAENTVNGTMPSTDATTASNPLKFSLVNNLGGEQLYVYVTGRDSNNQVVLVNTAGQFYYPNPAGSEVPVAIPSDAGHAIPLGAIGTTTEFSIPDYISSSRIWVSDGELQFFSVVAGDGQISLVEPSFSNPADPSSGQNWGFVEFTNNEGGIYANISFVDFIGIVMSMRLTLGSGEIQTVQGLAPGALEDICAGLQSQAAQDGQPWDKMCVTREDGTPLRILAPNMYITSNPGSMDSYYTDYINEVWAKYTNEDLIIDTQGEWGQVACRASGDQMTCAGDSLAYPKPTIVDVWGCNSGPFANTGDQLHLAIVARMCAAFHRTELLLDGGNLTPSLGSDVYYTANPTSHYSRLVHEHETDGKGYAFSYDDVNITGENEAGVVAGLDPQVLEIFIGGGLS
ncbi:putative glucan endo- -beta-glucosidase protein [Eutypa lata UCREL1]|uniref:Putative glucan endo--beta-glucosidase protein n=1 Tax=Eutypa lata (strain UCR-EL1) TaxID=1287681 RepID=M7SVL5_EUTLA|nr:putative glucan endo- -beta-glucosidase protein [Eutypa lata UCREL1]